MKKISFNYIVTLIIKLRFHHLNSVIAALSMPSFHGGPLEITIKVPIRWKKLIIMNKCHGISTFNQSLLIILQELKDYY